VAHIILQFSTQTTHLNNYSIQTVHIIMNYNLLLTCRLRVKVRFSSNATHAARASTLAFWLLRRLRLLLTCWRRLRVIVVRGTALRWMETKRYLDDEVVN